MSATATIVFQKMFPLENLPPEILLQVMEQLSVWCPPKNLLDLIATSPTCLRLFNQARVLSLFHLSSTTDWSVSSPMSRVQAFCAASIHLERGTPGRIVDGENFDRFVRPHVEHALWNDEHTMWDYDSEPEFWTDRERHYDSYAWVRESKPHLIQVLDLAAAVRRLIPRLVDRFRHSRPKWWKEARCHEAIQLPDHEDMLEEAFFRFEIYCAAFFHGDDVLAAEASQYRKRFFRRSDEAFSKDESEHDEQFHTTIHYVFQEHKSIVRLVAQDLGVPTDLDASDDGPCLAKKREELREAMRLQSSAPPVGEEATIRALQTLRLANRRLGEEDGYCRYLTSFGLDLIHRLLRMTPDEKRDYTLAEFSRFSLTQTPHACFPVQTCYCVHPGHRGCSHLWPAESTGTRWTDAKDRSRMSYTAWFWDVARLAEVGSNCY